MAVAFLSLRKLAKVEMLAKVGGVLDAFVGGNVTAVLNLVILALMGLSVLVALFFIIRGVRTRSQSSREAYGVGQQDARRSMQIDIVRGVSLVFVSLILLGVYSLSARSAASTVEPTFMPTDTAATSPATIPVSSPTATQTSSQPTVTPTKPPTVQTATATASPIPEPTEEPTPTARTATVISEVGVWVRGAPNADSEQLVWALGGTILTVLPEQETADDFTWQQVRTPGGIEGWVAADYIEINE